MWSIYDFICSTVVAIAVKLWSNFFGRDDETKTKCCVNQIAAPENYRAVIVDNMTAAVATVAAAGAAAVAVVDCMANIFLLVRNSDEMPRE